MEKMSRMSKYKDLREGIKNDVVSDAQTTYTKKEEPVRDADYYKRFLASEEAALDKPTKLQNAMSDDTLLESMTIDTINSQVDEELERALSRVRQESGQEDYNTRIDILNKIRQSKMMQEPEETDEEEELEQPSEDEDQDEQEEETAHRFGFFKRHQDDEDEVEEEDEQEEEEEQEDSKRGFGLFKRRQHSSEEDDDDEADAEEEEDDDDEDDEDNSTFVKVLNGIIVVLAIVLVALVGYIAKEFFL